MALDKLLVASRYMVDSITNYPIEGAGASKETLIYRVNHALEVGVLVDKTNGADIESVVAAVLHDVLEDTTVTHGMLEDFFGYRVTALVREVTAVSTKADGNRAARVAIDTEHYLRASHIGTLIKTADVLSNLKNIIANNPAFAKVYVPEKWAYLTRVKYPSFLLDEALTIAQDYLLGRK